MDFSFELRLRHHRVERRLGIGTLLWPNPVAPINLFNGSLISYALRNCETPSRNFYMRVGLDKSQKRAAYDRTCRSCANDDRNRSAQIQESRLRDAFLFHSRNL